MMLSLAESRPLSAVAKGAEEGMVTDSRGVKMVQKGGSIGERRRRENERERREKREERKGRKGRKRGNDIGCGAGARWVGGWSSTIWLAA